MHNVLTRQDFKVVWERETAHDTVHIYVHKCDTGVCVCVCVCVCVYCKCVHTCARVAYPSLLWDQWPETQAVCEFQGYILPKT